MTQTEQTAAYCESLITAHQYDPLTGACRCSEPYPCWVQVTAEDVADGLKRLTVAGRDEFNAAAAGVTLDDFDRMS